MLILSVYPTTILVDVCSRAEFQPNLFFLYVEAHYYRESNVVMRRG
jgi:hypothetical protein